MNKKIESAVNRLKYHDLFINEYFRDTKLTATGKFFNSIEIIKNEATTFDACYQHLHAFLKKIDVNHLLSENYSELFEKEINKE
jgi:hypothetical protein